MLCPVAQLRSLWNQSTSDARPGHLAPVPTPMEGSWIEGSGVPERSMRQRSTSVDASCQGCIRLRPVSANTRRPRPLHDVNCAASGGHNPAQASTVPMSLEKMNWSQKFKPYRTSR